MTFDEIVKMAEAAPIDKTSKGLFVSNRYYFEKTGYDAVEVNGVLFEKPTTPETIREWYRGVLEKVSQLGDIYKELFACCALEPWVFLRYACYSPHEIYLIVDGIKNAKKPRIK